MCGCLNEWDKCIKESKSSNDFINTFSSPFRKGVVEYLFKLDSKVYILTQLIYVQNSITRIGKVKLINCLESSFSHVLHL